MQFRLAFFRQNDCLLSTASKAQAKVLWLDQQQIAWRIANNRFRSVADGEVLEPATADDAHRDDLGAKVAPERWDTSG